MGDQSPEYMTKEACPIASRDPVRSPSRSTLPSLRSLQAPLNLNLRFVVLSGLSYGLAAEVVPALAKELDAAAVVTDMSPLRDPRRWVRQVADDLTTEGRGRPLFQVC